MRILGSFAFTALLAVFPGTGSCGTVWHSFGGDKVEVALPDDYAARVDERGKLTARFGPNGSHVIELRLKDYETASGRQDLAERALRKYGKDRKLPVSAVDGKLLLIEPDRDVTRGGIVYRRTHWHIAFGKSLVVLTLTAPIGEQMSPALTEFFRGTLDELIASLSRHNA